MEKKRSVGVTMLGILIILVGLGNLLLLFTRGYSSMRIGGILFNMYLIISGISILQLKNWARISILVISSLFALLSIISIVLFLNKDGLLVFLFTLVLLTCVIVPLFFTRHNIKEQFH